MNETTLRRALQVRLNDATYTTKKRQAKNPNMPGVTVTLDELVDLYHRQGGCCAATGVPMTSVEKKNGRYICNRWTTLSMDRLDNTQGYSIDNLRLTCWAANGMRGTLSVDESQAQFVEFAQALPQR